MEHHMEVLLTAVVLIYSFGKLLYEFNVVFFKNVDLATTKL